MKLIHYLGLFLLGGALIIGGFGFGVNFKFGKWFKKKKKKNKTTVARQNAEQKTSEEFSFVAGAAGPCEDNPPSFDISYDCHQNTAGFNSGTATLVLTPTNSNGTMSFYNAITGYPVQPGITMSHGEAISVYGLDEEGCKAYSQDIEVFCPTPCEAAPASFSMSYDCNPSADGSATLVLAQLSGTGQLSYYNSITGFPVQNGMQLVSGSEYNVYALDEAGCKALTQTITVACVNNDPCVLNPPTFSMLYFCELDANGDFTGVATLSLEQLSGDLPLFYYDQNTGEQLSHGMTLNTGQTIAAFAGDANGCQTGVLFMNVECTAPDTGGGPVDGDPCDDAPAGFNISYTCQEGSGGFNSGAATLHLSKVSGLGTLSYYNSVSGFPVHDGMALADGEVLSVYALDEDGCKALTQTISVDCEVPCNGNPSSFAISYNCDTTADGLLTGTATLVLEQLSGTGVMSYYNSETGMPIPNGMSLTNGQVVNVYGLDEAWCKANTQTITVSCDATVTDPCAFNPVDFVASYVCNTDGDGNLNGTANLYLEKTAGNGSLTYYTAADSPIANGAAASNGDSFSIYAVDEQGCVSATRTVSVVCEAIQNDCDNAPAAFNISYTCHLDANGYNAGTATLDLSKVSGTGDLSYYDSVTGFPVMNGITLSHGDQVNVYALDENWCKALTQTIEVNCPIPCEANPAAFSINYLCNTDVDGNPTGTAVLQLVQLGGTGTMSFYNSVTGYPVPDGMQLTEGETLSVYGLDEAWCKALTQTIEVECEDADGKVFDGGYSSDLELTGQLLETSNLLSFTGNGLEQTYILQKSINGEHFSTMTQVQPGTGAFAHFQYADEGLGAGTYYYRLVQADAEDRLKISNTVVIHRGSLQLTLNYIAPMPVRDIAELSFTSATDSEVSIVLYDLMGRIVIERKLAVPAGPSKVELDLQGLSPASYLLNINDGENYISQLLMKQ